MTKFDSRPRGSDPGNTKSMNVAMQIEVTEDAAQYLTPEMIRSAFQTSLRDGLDYTAVHKVLVEEENVIQKDKDGNDLEVLTAVPRVEPHPEWLKAYSVRDAFRMSIPDIGKGVHKVLSDEEWVKAEDKDGTEIEVLAVARIYPSAIWVLNNPNDIQEFLTKKNSTPRLNRARNSMDVPVKKAVVIWRHGWGGA